MGNRTYVILLEEMNNSMNVINAMFPKGEFTEAAKRQHPQGATMRTPTQALHSLSHILKKVTSEWIIIWRLPQHIEEIKNPGHRNAPGPGNCTVDG